MNITISPVAVLMRQGLEDKCEFGGQSSFTLQVVT